MSRAIFHLDWRRKLRDEVSPFDCLHFTCLLAGCSSMGTLHRTDHYGEIDPADPKNCVQKTRVLTDAQMLDELKKRARHHLWCLHRISSAKLYIENDAVFIEERAA